MTRDLFLNILAFLHLSDNATYVARGLAGHDPITKLGAVYIRLLEKFSSVWSPGQHVCIDEGMIAYRGSVSFKVYSPDKPDKYRMKPYMLCDSENRYCSCFELYTGKQKQDISPHGITYDLVFRLMDRYLYSGRILYVDNYYTSPQLFMDFFDKKGTGATGTARNRKGIPDRIKFAKLSKKGDKVTMHNGHLLCLKFLDRKAVTFLSTVHSDVFVDTGKKDAAGNVINRSEVNHLHNQYMQ